MLNFFEKRDYWGNGYAVWVVVLLTFMLPLIITSIRQLTLQNEVETWLPQNDPQAQLLSWFKEHFEDSDRFFITWDSSTFDDPRIEALELELRGFVDEEGTRRQASPFIQDLITPQKIVQRMHEQKVPADEAFQRIQGVVLGHGPLKVKLLPDGESQLDKVIAGIKQKLSTDLKLNVTVIPHAVETWRDPELKLTKYLEERRKTMTNVSTDESEKVQPPTVPEHHLQILWDKFSPEDEVTAKVIAAVKEVRGRTSQEFPQGKPLVEDCFIHAGAPVALIVDLSPTGKQNRKEALADLMAAAQAVHIPLEEIHLAGRPIGAETLNQEVLRSTWNKDVPIWMLHQRSIILLSGLVGILLSVLSLRSIRLAVMVLAVSYYTTAATVALVPVTGGTMNMVLIVMPSLLFVLTLSGAIHLANYWKHAVKLQKPNPVSYAVEMAWLPCFLAGFTTCLGLISLVTSPLAPVRDFGIYSAVGCIISLLMVLVALPSMLQIWAAKINTIPGNSGLTWKSYAEFLYRNHLPIHGLCWLVVIVAGMGLMYFRTETKVISYFTKESKIVKDYNYLEQNITGVNQVDIIIRFNISDEEDKDKFLKRMEIVRKVKEKIATHPEISGTLSLADFFPVDTPPSENQTRLALFTYNKKVTETYDRIFPEDVPGTNPFISKAKYDAKLSDSDTPLCKKDDELWRITAQALVTKDNDYGLLISQIDELVKSELKFHAQTRHFVTGMVPVFLRTQQAVLDSLISSFGLAYLMIGTVIVIALRSFFGGFIAMIPNLWPIAFVFGCISWSGWKIDIGTMVTASVALGIAVDGTLHLITWFQDTMHKGGTREEAICNSLMHCGPAMVQTSLIVAIGLLVLAPTDLLLISRFGILMAALIVAALIADIVFMPVILAGPLGKYLEVNVDKSSMAPTVVFAEEIMVEESESQALDTQFAKTVDEPMSPLQGPHKQPQSIKKFTS